MKTKLDRYRAKRDFKRTSEPRGSARPVAADHLRFVIQKHDATRLHYDLRLEAGGVFKSWAVTRGPSLDPADKRLAVEVEDHPLEYGDFEGTIPEGEYGGGTVMLWDRGFWMPEDGADPQKALERGELKFVLAGEKLRGSWVLVRMKHDRRGGKRTNWLLIKHREKGAPKRISARQDDRSVASGRTMKQIAAGTGEGPKPFITDARAAPPPDAVWSSREKPAAVLAAKASARAEPEKKREKKREPKRSGARASMPRFVEPQLCQLVSAPPDGEQWAHEVKLDGYRIQLRVENGTPALLTRKGLDWTDRFSAIAEAARSLPDALIDGELVAIDDRGMHDFGALQAALSSGEQGRLAYLVFDLLFAGGEDLRALPLADRKRRLGTMLAAVKRKLGGRIACVEHLSGPGKDVLAAACRMGLEGMVSKRLDAPYKSGRHGSWTKAKCRPGEEVVIGGWSGGVRALRSLLVGVHRGGKLTYAGRVGTGFDAAKTNLLLSRLKPIARSAAPFAGAAVPRKAGDVTWVEPTLVAEIEFAGFTRDGLVRQAAFKGLREDKPAKEVVPEVQPGTIPEGSAKGGKGKGVRMADVSSTDPARESAGSNVVMGVTVSHPGKELWPAAGESAPVTKLDLARYHEQVAPFLIEHIRGRPCSAVRAPDGIGGEQFFQRHAMQGMSKLVREVVVEGDRKPYLQIDEPAGLIAMAQIAAVELHPWNCAPDRPDLPGRLVFDLDPAPDLPFGAVIEAAKEMRARLRELGLEPLCKTTGGKGLHVVAPLSVEPRTRLGWPQAKAFAMEVCRRMAADSPERYLIKMTKKLRTGRIFLDYLRNDRMATAVAPLSPRARPGAPVSMPIGWSQVRAGLDPARFTIRTAPSLIAKSKPWREYDECARPLGPAVKSIQRKR